MQIVLGDAGEEFFKTLSRFRRGGDDELSVPHCEVYLRFLTELGFEGNGLGMRRAKLCPHRWILVRMEPPPGLFSFYGSTKKIPCSSCQRQVLRAQVINYGFIAILPAKDMSNLWQ